MTKTLPPNFLPGELRTLKPVIAGPIPEVLYVCTAKVRADMAAALRARFEIEGIELSGRFKLRYEGHLAYSVRHSDQFYEAGFSADFTEALFIYQTATLEEAKSLFCADPFFQSEVFSEADIVAWEIHPPLFKGHYPPMPEQVIEVEVEVSTPENLIASFGTFNPAPLQAWAQGKVKRPLHQLLHMVNMYGDGGIANMGFAWACGPTLDYSRVLHVLAVPTIEMAKWVNQMDALYRWGMIKDFRYFEWCIHYPIQKACPRHKGTLQSMVAK